MDTPPTVICQTRPRTHALATSPPLHAAETDVAPRAALRLARVFGADALGAFEAAATLLARGWCAGWFEAFPAPPVGVLRRVLVRARGADALLSPLSLRHPALRPSC